MKDVTVIVDRPLGSFHPDFPQLRYPVNYGYVPGTIAGDGEEQDAYILGVLQPVEHFTGKLLAVIRRSDDVEEKWIIVPDGLRLTENEIMEQVAFQEQYFHSNLIMLD